MIQPFFDKYEMLIRLVYSIIVTFSCLLIFFKTKLLYKLSNYKGIKYFRNTFLFLGIAYLSRIILSINFLLNLSRFANRIISGSMIFIMVYASSAAFIYLLLSLLYKKITWKQAANPILINLVAIIIALASLDQRHPIIFLLLQTILLVLLIVSGFFTSRGREKVHKLYKFYVLILSLWIISNFSELITHFSPIIGWLVYTASIITFIIILRKVLKSLEK